MITVGIDIDSSKAIIYAVKFINGAFDNINGDFKTIVLHDEYDNSQIREFQSTIHSFFDTIKPNRIGIIKRNAKGKFASSPTSFKLEGLIQTYLSCDVEFVSPQTLTAFYKTNSFIVPSNKYQVNASKLAQYLVS